MLEFFSSLGFPSSTFLTVLYLPSDDLHENMAMVLRSGRYIASLLFTLVANLLGPRHFACMHE